MSIKKICSYVYVGQLWGNFYVFFEKSDSVRQPVNWGTFCGRLLQDGRRLGFLVIYISN